MKLSVRNLDEIPVGEFLDDAIKEEDWKRNQTTTLHTFYKEFEVMIIIKKPFANAEAWDEYCNGQRVGGPDQSPPASEPARDEGMAK